MKTRIQKLLVGAALVGAATLVQAQFTYFDFGNGTCAITGYTGSRGAVAIPNSINGLGVVSIGLDAFAGNGNLTSVTIPDSVITIGEKSFIHCWSLTSVSIGNGVTSIGANAFYLCTSLTSVTMGNGVTSIGYEALGACFSLTAAYFLGNAPPDPGNVFGGATIPPDPVIVYYLPGATGWGPFFSGVPTELWNAQATALGVVGGHFGFNITGPSNTVVVVEACTNLARPVWLPVSTNALNESGTSYFSDPQWTNYPARFYRLRSP